MELLEILKEAAKSPTTVFTIFLQQYSKYDNNLHIFHEGKDDPSFYGNFIQDTLKMNQEVYYYQAKSKDNVYENYKRINWASYSKKRILFFVDKDFADILQLIYPVDKNIFVTTFYSIENYLVSNVIFSRSLRDLIGLDNDNLNKNITRQFQNGLKTFYESSLILSAYILYHRMNKNPLNLRNVTFLDIFRVNDSFIVTRKSKTLAILDRKTGATTKTAFKEIKGILIGLKQISNPKVYVRGKFELAYMLHCINNTPNIINYGKKEGEKKYKNIVLLSISNAIPILAPRIRQPKEINIFFKTLK